MAAQIIGGTQKQCQQQIQDYQIFLIGNARLCFGWRFFSVRWNWTSGLTHCRSQSARASWLAHSDLQFIVMDSKHDRGSVHACSITAHVV